MTTPDPARIADIRRAFIAPRELGSSRPRDVQLTGLGRFIVVLALALFATALVLGGLLYRQAVRQADTRRALNAHGVTTTAAITRVWRASNDSKQPWVAYRFEAAGSVYEAPAKMRLARWRTLAPGSTVPIKYLPEDPRQCVILGSEPGVLPMSVPVLVAAALSAGGLLSLWGLGRQHRLLVDGRPAPALVTGVTSTKSSHGGHQRAITYSFPLLSGAIAQGKSEAPGKATGVGSVICVVYDPDRPRRRNRPYPFPLVRAARLR
jgi:hypothetical protein